MNKQNMILPHQRIIFSNKKELLKHGRTEKNLRCTVLSERSQTPKAPDYRIPPKWLLEKAKR